MKHPPSLLVFFWLILISAPLFSANNHYGARGSYLQVQGGGGGLLTLHYPQNLEPYDQVRRQNGLAYRFSAGYLFLQNQLNYGVELGYLGYPKNTYSFSFLPIEASGVQTYQSQAVDLLGILRLTLHSKGSHTLYLFTKAGVTYLTQTYNGRSAALNTLFIGHKSVSQLRPAIAVGLGYLINEHLDLNLSYHYLFAGRADPLADTVVNQAALAQLTSVEALMIGAAYHF